MILTSFIFAVIILTIGNTIFIHQRNALRVKERTFVDADFSKPLIIRAATVADDLFPITSELDLNGGTVEIVGGDGEYIALSNGARLKEGLKDWLSRGATIQYYLVCPSDRALNAFTEFSNEVGDRFEVIVMDRCHDTFDFSTLHPTLFRLKNNSQTAMWIEYNHPSNSTIAYNVKYVSPVAMKGNHVEMAEYEKFENMIAEFSQQAA